jgi:hypothetical protein
MTTPGDHERAVQEPLVGQDKQTGLAVIECQQAAAATEEITPQRVADLLLDQEAGWHHGQ